MVCMCSSNKYSCIGDYTFCFYVIKVILKLLHCLRNFTFSKFLCDN